MTEGHKHHELKVKRNGLIQRILQYPLIFRPFSELERVEKSPYPYAVMINGVRLTGGRIPDNPSKDEIYYLSALGILHRWVGLTLNVKEK